MTTDHSRNRSGGGIVFGGGARGQRADGASLADAFRAVRRRWASGIAVVTAVDSDGSLRGLTATSLMVVSMEPPVVAIALSVEGSFHELAVEGHFLGFSVLESIHEFPAERFAGRAPLPDGRFTGVAHRIVDGLPVLDGALAWGVGTVIQRDLVGDHWLVLVEIGSAAVGEDSDDPLLSYEGRYRRLEAG